MATDYSDILLPEEPTAPAGAVAGNTMFPTDYSDILLPEGAVVSPVTVDDPDSFSSNVGRSLNEFQKSFFEGAGVIGRLIGSQDLESWAKGLEEEQVRDIASYGTPQRTASLTEGLGEVEDIYDDKGLGAAIERTGLLLQDMLANAIGSIGVPIAASLAAIPVAAVGGATAGAATLFLAPFIAGGVAGTGQIREEALRIGADPENVDQIAAGGGAVVGLLDKIGAGFAVKALVKQFSKEAVVDKFAEDVGKDVAKDAVDKALEFSLKTVKGGVKAGVAESGTEALQELTQISAAGLAADKGLMPYEGAILRNRLIDAAALGFIGGAPIGSASTAAGRALQVDSINRAKELEEITDKMRKTVDDLDTELASGFSTFTGSKATKLRESRGIVSGLYKTALAPLKNFARRSEEGGQVFNLIENYPMEVSAAVGKDVEQLRPVFDNLRRSFRIPLVQKEIPPEINRRLYKAYANNTPDQDPRINEAVAEIKKVLGEGDIDLDTGKVKKRAVLNKSTLKEFIFKGKANPKSEVVKAINRGDVARQDLLPLVEALTSLTQQYESRVAAEPSKRSEIKNEIINSDQFKALENKVIFEPANTGKYKELTDAGISLGFEENYLPRMYKTGPLARRKMQKVLQNRGYSRLEAVRVTDAIERNEGIYDPDKINLTVGAPESKKLFSSEEAFEKKRTLTQEDVNALENAGLVETNVESLLSKYFLNANRRIISQRLANKINEAVPKLIKDKNMSQVEANQIKAVFDATQDKLNPLSDNSFKTAQKWLLTSQYILTLPLAGLTALSEPLIILSRISPKYALFGTIDAAYNAIRQGKRAFMPRTPLTAKEKAFRGILEGMDGAMADRFGDLAGVTVSRKVTNAFFKATLLTTITQISRDIAFQATRRQMRDDLASVYRASVYPYSGKKTKGVEQAKRRLLEQGIVNPESDVIRNWFETDPRSGVPDPDIIRKSMSKTVNEFIMAPNAVNRPLWMSDPRFAAVAQLKGFMLTFGNVVGGRMWREVIQPVYTAQRLPVGEALKYGVALSAIIAASLAIQGLKDDIRYSDNESPFDRLDGRDKVLEAILNTNIMGGFTLLYDSLKSREYGSNFWASLLGPAASNISNVLEGGYDYAIKGNSRNISREIANLIPLLRNIPMARDTKNYFVDYVEENLEEFRDNIVDFIGD
jgi:hypothetical protein